MASSSHRRSRPERRPIPAPAAVVAAVAAVALAVSLIVAFRPGGGGGEGRTVESVAGGQVSGSPTASTPPSAPASASPSETAASASPTATTATPTPAASAARPSPSTPVAAADPAEPVAQAAAGSARLAGRIRPGTAYEGVATSYDVGDGDGACSYGPTSDVMTAAMNTADYETSKACGAYVSVRAAGGAAVTVRITNECPAPCEAGQLDLSRQAFAELAPLSAGRIPITWTLLSPATSDKISIRYKTGSTQYWCGIQAIGHRNPLARLEVRSGGAWIRLARTGYNYFLSESGAGCGGPIRLTDVYGEQLTVNGIGVHADAVQATGAQFTRR